MASVAIICVSQKPEGTIFKQLFYAHGPKKVGIKATTRRQFKQRLCIKGWGGEDSAHLERLGPRFRFTCLWKQLPRFGYQSPESREVWVFLWIYMVCLLGSSMFRKISKVPWFTAWGEKGEGTLPRRKCFLILD